MPLNTEQCHILTKATIRAGKLLGIDQERLSLLLEVDPDRMLLLNAGKKALDPLKQEWRHAILLVGCYSALSKLLSTENSAQMTAWMSSQNSDLGGVPIVLLSEPNGLKLLEQYLSTKLISSAR